ncbi:MULTISPECIES: hypothetical protein [Nocardia]|uniref:hypothetical protein n=1 Tax=Nocardia TaxID=1817 RepID=UPI00189342DC|nr:MULTISPECIES: hypothetical protein [Nocardia]MBF6350849.1 hypothetical protein [Nocardia flavorosea]
MTNPSSLRLGILAGLAPILFAVPNLVLLATAADNLPDPLATHFSASGADGFTGRVATMGIAAALAVGLGALFAVLVVAANRKGAPARRPDTTLDPNRLFVASAWGVGALLGVILFASTRANLGLADPAQATLPGWMFPVAAVIALLSAAVGWLIAPPSPVAEGGPAPAEPLPIGRTERVSWSRRATSPWMLLAGGASVALGVAVGFVVHPGVGVLAVLAGVLVGQLALVRVVVDQRGLTVGTGLLGWPRWRLAPAEITEVAAADISPAHYGGYGIRLTPGATAVVLRGGPGIVVTRRSGRQFAVTVDDAQTGAGVLAGVVQKAA